MKTSKSTLTAARMVLKERKGVRYLKPASQLWNSVGSIEVIGNRIGWGHGFVVYSMRL